MKNRQVVYEPRHTTVVAPNCLEPVARKSALRASRVLTTPGRDRSLGGGLSDVRLHVLSFARPGPRPRWGLSDGWPVVGAVAQSDRADRDDVHGDG